MNTQPLTPHPWTLAAACSPAPTVPPTSTPVPTPTEENCYWTWGPGGRSTAYEAVVQQKLEEAGLTGTVETSIDGELYSCDGSFHAAYIQVRLKVQVADVSDRAALGEAAAQLSSIAEEAMEVSEAPNLDLYLTFAASEAGDECRWDVAAGRCG